MLHRFLSTAVSLALLACTGCAVYVPTVPSTPLVSKGEVEVSVGARLLPQGAAEVDAAWAPTSHLLVNVESSFQEAFGFSASNNSGTSFRDYHRQVGVGLGYYRAPATPGGWYLAALGGVGLAGTVQHDVLGTYEARYRRGYVQGYAARSMGRLLRGGFSLRATVVDYQQLDYEGTPYSPTNRVFLEPTLFARLGQRAFQGQFAFGLSQPLRSDRVNYFNVSTSPTTWIVGAALIVRPGYWRQRRN